MKITFSVARLLVGFIRNVGVVSWGLLNLLTQIAWNSEGYAASQSATYRWLPIHSKQVNSFYIERGRIFPSGEEDPVPIEGTDIATFQVAVFSGSGLAGNGRASNWARDKGHFYFAGQIIAGADSKTFTIVDGQVAKDSRHVYCWDFGKGGEFKGEVNTIADPTTFRKLTAPNGGVESQFWYYQDAKHVFSKWCTLVDGADPETFQMVANPTVDFDARDKNRKYGLGQARAGSSPK